MKAQLSCSRLSYSKIIGVGTEWVEAGTISLPWLYWLWVSTGLGVLGVPLELYH